MTETWKVINGTTGLEDPDVYDLQVVDAVNRFARQAKVTLIDYDGTKHLEYPQATPITIQVKPKGATDYFTRWGGFVADVERKDRTTTLILYSFDLWLRRRDVLRNFEDMLISDILEDLITTLTPLDWDPAKVNVQNDITISRRWKGERLDSVIDDLANASAKENWGADDTGTFFFRPRTDVAAPVEFVEGRYDHIEFDEDTRQEVNQVKVFYGQPPNTGSIVEFDGERQQELSDILNRPRPVVVEINTAFPEITFDPAISGSKQAAEDAARRKARAILDGKTGILKGDLITWGAFDAFAGNIVFVSAPRQDVQTDFRIAELEYNYLSGETRIKIAENTEGVIDMLVAMSQEVTRIDLRAADPDTIPTQYVTAKNPVGFEVKLKVWKQTVPDDMFIWGESFGGWGDPVVGGGNWGDSRDPPELILET